MNKSFLKTKVKLDKKIYIITSIIIFLFLLLIILPCLRGTSGGFSLFTIWSYFICAFNYLFLNIRDCSQDFLIGLGEVVFLTCIYILVSFFLGLIPAALISTIQKAIEENSREIPYEEKTVSLPSSDNNEKGK